MTQLIMRYVTVIGIAFGVLALPAGIDHAAPQNCAGAPASHLVIGRDAITTEGVPNLRDKPGLAGKIYVQIPANVRVMVLDGPVCADKYAWWKVDYAGQTGYIAEGDPKLYYALPTTTPIKKFDLGTNANLDINYQGIQFTYTGTFGTLVEADQVFAVVGDPSDPMLPATPKYTEFRFRQNAHDTNVYGPTLSVYPLDDFKTANPDIGPEFDKLANVVQKKPRTLPDDFPIIPMVNAGQVFHSNVSYLDFATGSGVRFVTMYASDVSPISPDRTVLVFNGLSDDGKFYVTATFPVAPDVLTGKRVPFPDMNSSNAGNLYTQYVTTTVANLNKSTSDQFTPNLDDVDTLLSSVSTP